MEKTLQVAQDLHGIFSAIKEMTEHEGDDKNTALATLARIGLEKVEGVMA